MATLSSITTATTTLANVLMVNPQQTIGYQPQNPPGSNQPQPKSLLFHYEGENTVELNSDITDHYVEDNTAIQDQIALKPEIITAHGFIGELNDVIPAQFSALQTVADKLVAVSGFTPGFSATALNALNEAFFGYQVAAQLANTYADAIGALSGSGESVINGNDILQSQNQNKQQTMFQKFYVYWKTRTLFTVQTPWAVFQDCAIQSLKAVQDQDTRMITDFQIQFKLMRFTSSLKTQVSALQGRLQAQGSDLNNTGANVLQQSTQSFSPTGPQ